MKEQKSLPIPKEYKVKLAEVRELYPAVKLFVFDFNKEFDFIPGQFVVFEIKDKKGYTVRRSYSLSSSPGKKNIELVMNIVPGGKMTQALDKLKVGEKIKLIGPYGRFGNSLESSSKDMMLIAAGTGITPIKGLIDHLIKSKFQHKMTLVYGFRHETNFLFKERFEELADENKNFILLPTVSQPVNAKHWDRHVGRVTDYLSENLNSKNLDQEFYICGLAPMVRDTKRVLLERGVKAEQIHIEVW